MKFHHIVIIALINLFISVSACADNLHDSLGYFDFEQKTKYLNQIDQQLLQKNNNYNDLVRAEMSITASIAQANACSKYTKGQAQAILPIFQNESVKQDPARYHYLSSMKTIYDKKNADCSFYVFLAQKTLHNISLTMIKNSANKIFKKTPIIWNQFHLDPLHYNTELFYQSAPGIMLIFAYALLGYLCTLVFAKYLTIPRSKSNLLFLSNKQLSILPQQSVFFFVLSVIIYGRISDYTEHDIAPSSPFLWLIVVDSIIAIRLYVTLSENNHIALALFRRISVVATILLLGFIGTLFWVGQSIPPDIIVLCQMVWITLINLLLLWINWLMFRLHFFAKTLSPHALKITKMILPAIYGLVIVWAWSGFLHLAQAFIPNLIASLMIILLTWESTRYLGNAFFVWFQSPSSKLANKLHRFFALERHKKFIEVSILRWVFNIPILVFLVVGLALIWGASAYTIDQGIAKVRDGSHIGSIVINTTIVYAVAVFCLVSLSGRALAMYLSRSKSFKGDPHRQVTIRILITYIAFSLALIAAFLRLGFDFSKIALIMGGLSVGLGFGLKEVVSDFVSGLILLITKPIKIGDHVMLDGTEGFIKKIGLFSTQLLTLSQSVAILPNSLLKNRPLDNYTFQDRSSRLSIQVLLDQEEDLDLAQELVLSVALKNSHVIQTPPHQPTVLLDQILSGGTLALIVDLVFFIKDVDFKDRVISDLNLAIVQTFKEKNVGIKAR